MSRLLVLPTFAMFVFVGCSARNVAENIVKNRDELGRAIKQPLAIHSARNTNLLRAGLIFYPDGSPMDPDVLPPLTDAQLKIIEEIVGVELQSVHQVQVQHSAFLVSRFPGHDPKRVPIQFELFANGDALAVSDSGTGMVAIDASVVQAIFRAALVSIFSDSSDYGFDPAVGETISKSSSLRATERAAFAAFSNFRWRLGNLSSFTFASDAAAMLGGMSAAEEMLDRRLHDSETILESRQLESAFLNAIRFMVAHEAAHIAMGHPVSADTCAQARANEDIADRYATIVSGLVAYQRAAPIVLESGATPNYQIQKSPLLEESVLAPADGSSEFFRFAYTLAGFGLALGQISDCEYPSPRVRQEALEPYGYAYYQTFTFAQNDEALRRFGSREVKRYYRDTDPFPRVFAALPKIVSMNNESLDQNHKLPDDLEAERTVLSEVYNAIFRKN
jgi:hypothetical protein